MPELPTAPRAARRPNATEVFPVALIDDLVARTDAEMAHLRDTFVVATAQADEAEARLNAHPAAAVFDDEFEAEVLARVARIAAEIEGDVDRNLLRLAVDSQQSAVNLPPRPLSAPIAQPFGPPPQSPAVERLDPPAPAPAFGAFGPRPVLSAPDTPAFNGFGHRPAGLNGHTVVAAPAALDLRSETSPGVAAEAPRTTVVRRGDSPTVAVPASVAPTAALPTVAVPATFPSVAAPATFPSVAAPAVAAEPAGAPIWPAPAAAADPHEEFWAAEAAASEQARRPMRIPATLLVQIGAVVIVVALVLFKLG